MGSELFNQLYGFHTLLTKYNAAGHKIRPLPYRSWPCLREPHSQFPRRPRV
jgi:hypothetical protein